MYSRCLLSSTSGFEKTMMEQIEEIAELITPRLFPGKKFSELSFFEGGKGIRIENSELFQVCAMAQHIRLEAIRIAREDLHRDYSSMDWPQLLQVCEIVIERKDKAAQR